MLNFYPRLAVQNLVKNKSTYLPYLLTGTLCVAMFYIMLALSLDDGLSEVPGAAIAMTIFFLGTLIIAIFCCALVFYTNSFLIKRRTSEFGLYCVLGMEKRHVGLVLFFETLFTTLICIVLGLVFGAVFSKFLYLALLYVMDVSTPLQFSFSPSAAFSTLVLFLCIYGATLLYNVFHIRMARPVELLSSRQKGEREPRASWVLTLIGIASLAWGYFIAVTVNDPLNALLLFFLAVLMVIIGTFCLFTSGSIALLKFLKRRKNYYYTPEHFISVSGLIYRMKQNATGLAAICILSTMVLVTVSTTICLYAGRDDMLANMYPSDIKGVVTLSDGQTLDGAYQAVEDSVAQDGSLVENLWLWREVNTTVNHDGQGNLRGVAADQPADASLMILPLADYNRAFGTAETLQPGQVLLYSTDSETPSALNFGGTTVQVAKKLEDFAPLCIAAGYPNVGLMIVVAASDEEAVALHHAVAQPYEQGETLNVVNLYLNVSGSPDQQALVCRGLTEHTPEGIYFQVNSRASTGSEWYRMYGSFLFLGLFLGTLFLMATVLIIYYKQISEGYDDHDRFIILQQVGMSQQEVKKTINKQVLLVFFLPLAMALIHLLFAFNVIANILLVFSMNNRALFAACCAVIFAIFAVVYLVIYRVTAKSYYRLVRA